MRPIEKIGLLERIGADLQSKMTYSDIDIYLSDFDIDTKHTDESHNSKRVYVKEQLAIFVK